MRVVLLLSVLMLGGCKAEEPAADPASPRAASSPEAQAEPAAEPEPEPDHESKPEPESDPERADKLADLDDMCRALDHDYVDGTLTDYYGDLKPRTQWGAAQREAGDATMRPGRLLEAAVAELSPGAKDPALEHCRKLLDYLDEVE